MQGFPVLQNYLWLPEDSPQLRCPRQREIHLEGNKIASSAIAAVAATVILL